MHRHLLTDLAGTIGEANRAALSLFGGLPQHLDGQPVAGELIAVHCQIRIAHSGKPAERMFWILRRAGG